jgi:hypothetical protein
VLCVLCVQVIYYKGKNDAWDGYGGATVYTKARQLPEVGMSTPSFILCECPAIKCSFELQQQQPQAVPTSISGGTADRQHMQ